MTPVPFPSLAFAAGRMVPGPVSFVALDSKPVAGVQELWSWPGVAIGLIPSLVSKDLHKFLYFWARDENRPSPC